LAQIRIQVSGLSPQGFLIVERKMRLAPNPTHGAGTIQLSQGGELSFYCTPRANCYIAWLGSSQRCHCRDLMGQISAAWGIDESATWFTSCHGEGGVYQ